MQNLLLADLVVDLPRRASATARLQRARARRRGPVATGGRPSAPRGRGRPDPGRAGPALRGAAASPAGRHPGASGRHDSTTLPDPYDGLINGMAGEPAGARLHGHQPACRGPALGRADAGRTGGRHLRRRGPVRIARADHAGGSGAAHHAAGGRDARAAPDAGQSRADGTPADNHEILGQSEPIARLLHEIDVVADSELPILLLGETGVGRNCSRTACTGCRAAAQAAGARELRRPARVAGRERAVRPRQGRVSRWPTGPAASAANGGTLFLDEVGELPLLVQAKLAARAAERRDPAPGRRPSPRADVRIVAATNRSLKDLVRDGDFRADLYHRLSVYPIAIPPLRERGNAAAGRPLPGTEPRPAGPAQPAAGAGRRGRPCAATAGRATCASWSMSSAVPPSRR